MTNARNALVPTRLGVIVALGLMLLGVFVVYSPSRYESGKLGLGGTDHSYLHMRRMTFARESILIDRAFPPGWYPHELMGTPFWSNIQNFPFLPTRLLVLLFVEPFNAMTVGTILAALLAASFTFLYCRSVGLSPVSAAVAGWTFASAGFFASRVFAGHLPLLEAYPSMPLLLWLVERALKARAEPVVFSKRLFGLGLACGCVALAGHPQLPIYSLAIAALYFLYRDHRLAGRVGVGSMLIGASLSAFALWPMLRLIGRSTRVLALDRPENDIAMPYGRLLSFFYPWIDGSPAVISHRSPMPEFSGYRSFAHFYDTVCYIGLAPWIALLLLLAIRIWSGRQVGKPWPFFAVVGSAAVVFALPAWQDIMAHIPGTFLRSPARQIYVTTFALALALGVAIDAVIRLAHGRWRRTIFITLGLAIVAHGLDLWMHARAFVVTTSNVEELLPESAAAIKQRVGDGRIAMDYSIISKWNRQFNDVGFFDSIMLARPYRGLFDLDQAPPGKNVQGCKGSSLRARTLAACGVRLIMSEDKRHDLEDLTVGEAKHAYLVPDATPRVAFFEAAAVQVMPSERIHEQLRTDTFDPNVTLLLRDDEAIPPGEAPSPSEGPAQIAYHRVSPDLIEVNVSTPTAGWIQVLESWDTGWTARVNGSPTQVAAGNVMFLALRVEPGSHRVLLAYNTPSALTGMAISCCALLGLAGLTVSVARTHRRLEP
jgi:hypothetical protein